MSQLPVRDAHHLPQTSFKLWKLDRLFHPKSLITAWGSFTARITGCFQQHYMCTCTLMQLLHHRLTHVAITSQLELEIHYANTLNKSTQAHQQSLLQQRHKRHPNKPVIQCIKLLKAHLNDLRAMLAFLRRVGHLVKRAQHNELSTASQSMLSQFNSIAFNSIQSINLHFLSAKQKVKLTVELHMSQDTIALYTCECVMSKLTTCPASLSKVLIR